MNKKRIIINILITVGVTLIVGCSNDDKTTTAMRDAFFNKDKATWSYKKDTWDKIICSSIPVAFSSERDGCNKDIEEIEIINLMEEIKEEFKQIKNDENSFRQFVLESIKSNTKAYEILVPEIVEYINTTNNRFDLELVYTVLIKINKENKEFEYQGKKMNKLFKPNEDSLLGLNTYYSELEKELKKPKGLTLDTVLDKYLLKLSYGLYIKCTINISNGYDVLRDQLGIKNFRSNPGVDGVTVYLIKDKINEYMSLKEINDISETKNLNNCKKQVKEMNDFYLYLSQSNNYFIRVENRK